MATKQFWQTFMKKLSHKITPEHRLLMLSWLLIICTALNLISLHSEKMSYVDSQLKPFVDNFLFDSFARGVSVDVSDTSFIFGLEDEKDIEVAGMCRTRGLEHRVEISKYVWDMLATEEKEILIYHEAAHCLLNRKHCEKKIDGVPLSIMYPSIIDFNIYKLKREKYIDELFNKDMLCE